ncbi:hypothetical protein [Serratia marcescens]|uniref:hypothetical protein n=1 Tax=Serratia marcescens TaxID=615 RepID=UPI000B5F16EF|nr:hypothetical protein [Serratia marcescens]ASM07220.1 hypothetical protein BVG91_09355 [Serratia marcescens]
MGNKLSELSKPVAWRYRYTKPGITDSNGEAWVGDWKFVTDEVNCNPAPNYQKCALYSQEYVSALLAERDSNQQNYQNAMEELRIERSQRQAADQRIAELEDIRANASQVFKEIGNELGCNPDNESIMMAIDDLKEREKRVVALAGGNADLWETMAARLEAAEAKLATPVRLTEERTLWAGEDDYDTGHVKGWNANRIEQAALLKKQGFKVEGDA